MDPRYYLRFKQRLFDGLMAMTPEERQAWIDKNGGAPKTVTPEEEADNVVLNFEDYGEF